MSNQTDHTIVRLRVPPELKQKIEDSAEKNNRSQSAEMVARLEQSFEPEPKATETFEFEAMKRLYLEQSAQIKELRDMLKELIKKPT